jgi:RNA polymerase sigma-70 factor, ECF subfamily
MSSVDTTVLLTRIKEGDKGARDELIAALYPELHAIAARLMRHEAVGHTLQTTAVVSEAYIRLTQGKPGCWENRPHFLGAAAQVMRHILVDHARAKCAGVRGGPDARRLPIEDVDIFAEENFEERLEIDSALTALTQEHARAARVLEARVFGGLSIEEISVCLGVSSKTIKRDLEFARAWMWVYLKMDPKASS